MPAGRRRKECSRFSTQLCNSTRRAVVIEVDGKHHYAQGDRADPTAYASMVSQDRRLRLAGYEVYHFGGAEFVDKIKTKQMLDAFFDELLKPLASQSL